MESSSESITLVRDALHNPGEPRHFMRIGPTEEMFVACIGQTELARSSQALKLKEVAYDIYDPVIYFPREDVRMTLLARTERSTHCPLKGFEIAARGNFPVTILRRQPHLEVIRSGRREPHIARAERHHPVG